MSRSKQMAYTRFPHTGRFGRKGSAAWSSGREGGNGRTFRWGRIARIAISFQLLISGFKLIAEIVNPFLNGTTQNAPGSDFFAAARGSSGFLLGRRRGQRLFLRLGAWAAWRRKQRFARLLHTQPGRRGRQRRQRFWLLRNNGQGALPRRRRSC